MFSIFPCFWNLPRRKPIKSLADHHFPPRTVIISKPVPLSVPEPVKAPVKIERPKDNFSNADFERVKNFMPPEELCLGEAPVDTTEIDLMLSELDNPSPESRAERILQMIKTVNENIGKTINIFQTSPAVENNISREELLKLLQMFSSFSKTLEQYFKEQTPSLL